MSTASFSSDDRSLPDGAVVCSCSGKFVCFIVDVWVVTMATQPVCSSRVSSNRIKLQKCERKWPQRGRGGVGDSTPGFILKGFVLLSLPVSCAAPLLSQM